MMVLSLEKTIYILNNLFHSKLSKVVFSKYGS
jgi:hypothetical protein